MPMEASERGVAQWDTGWKRTVDSGQWEKGVAKHII